MCWVSMGRARLDSVRETPRGRQRCCESVWDLSSGLLREHVDVDMAEEPRECPDPGEIDRLQIAAADPAQSTVAGSSTAAGSTAGGPN